MSTAAVVLAAGASSRFGRSKLTLEIGGRGLLENAVACAKEAGCAPVVVVLQDERAAGRLGRAVEGALIAVNPAWREGMAGTVRAGVAAVEKAAPDAPGVVLIVADQPRLTPAVLVRLLDRFRRRPERIVASAYAGTFGVPAVFGRDYFERLRALRGRGGAKPLLEANRERLITVDWSDGELDVDRPEDLLNAAGPSRRGARTR